MEKLPKYIVRPHDFMVWERWGDTDLYRSYEKPGKGIKNRQDPYDHWNYDNLVNGYGFIPISENEVEDYDAKHDFEIRFLSWQHRNDGHGGVKGGTRQEYLDYLKRVEEFYKEHPEYERS